MGKTQNVTTTIKQSMISAGYNVELYGKMDIGGGMGGGYHSSSNGNWSNQLKGCNVSTSSYCPGDIIHSWTRKAKLMLHEIKYSTMYYVFVLVFSGDIFFII